MTPVSREVFVRAKEVREMTFKEGLGVYTRTFVVLAGAALVAVQGLEWADTNLIGNNALTLGLMLLSAAVASFLAVGAAYLIRPSASNLEKAIRAAIEKLLAGFGVVAFSSVADLVAFGKLVPAVLIAAVFSFFITLASTEPPPVPVPPAS